MKVETTYRQETSFLPILWIALTCLLAGAMIGATTNAINGYVSPTYFQNILGWDFEGIWLASIAQGVFEGIMYGIIFSLVFGTTIAVVGQGRASYRFAISHLIKVIGVIYSCWILGGLAGVGLAALSPDFYRQTFIQVPAEFQAMLAYAWVGGSIWGGMLGGLVGLTFGIIHVRTSWKKER